MDRPTKKKSNRQITSRGQLEDEIDDFIDLFVSDYKITSEREIARISKRATRRLVNAFETSGVGLKQLSAVIRQEFRRSQIRTFPDLPGGIYISSVGQIAEEVSRYDVIAKKYGITSDAAIQQILGFAVARLTHELNTTGVFSYSHLRKVVQNQYLNALSLLHRNKPMMKIQSRIVTYEKTQRYVRWKLAKLRQAEAKLLL